MRCCFYRTGGYLFELDLPVPPDVDDKVTIAGSLHVVRDRVWVLPSSSMGEASKINIEVDWLNPLTLPTY